VADAGRTRAAAGKDVANFLLPKSDWTHFGFRKKWRLSAEIDQDSLARLLARLVPVGDGPWRLTMGRTNWQFDKGVPGGRV
jgi:hypothetical protein